MMDGRLEALEAEVKRLRDWRHDVVQPRLSAVEKQVGLNSELLRETAAVVASMQREDEFAQRLAAEMHKRRWQALTAAEKAVLLLFACVPFVTLLLTLSGVTIR